MVERDHPEIARFESEDHEGSAQAERVACQVSGQKEYRGCDCRNFANHRRTSVAQRCAKQPEHARVQPIGAGSGVDEEIAIGRLAVHHPQRAIEVDPFIGVERKPVRTQPKQHDSSEREHDETGAPIRFEIQL